MSFVGSCSIFDPRRHLPRRINLTAGLLRDDRPIFLDAWWRLCRPEADADINGLGSFRTPNITPCL